MNLNTSGPGPGAYSSMRPESQRCGNALGKEQRRGFVWDPKNRVGPGQYDWAKTTAKSTSWSMGKDPRVKEGNFLNTPGPGKYDHKDVQRALPAYSVGRESRYGNKPGTAPGPGQYYPQRSRPSGWTFGRELRGKKVQSTPGYYDIPPCIPDVPKYLLCNNSVR
jgi:hypothetical protein